MTTNLKLELFKACIFILIGVFLCKQFAPQPKSSSNQPEISQVQMSDCQVIVKKVTKPDGSVDEVTEFLSSSKQKQEVSQKQDKSLSVLLGVATNKKAALEINYNKFSYEVLTDFNKNHVHVLKYKVIEF